MDCIFCKIIDKKIPASLEYEDSELIAFRDINPQAPVHVLFIPRKHMANMQAVQEKDAPVIGRLFYQARRLAEERGWKDYRLVINNGPEAGQSVDHVHLHLLSGRRMTWPPG